jgi:hypothetical protein
MFARAEISNVVMRDEMRSICTVARSQAPCKGQLGKWKNPHQARTLIPESFTPLKKLFQWVFLFVTLYALFFLSLLPWQCPTWSKISTKPISEIIHICIFNSILIHGNTTLGSLVKIIQWRLGSVISFILI